jgi:hypothetical protein
MVVQTEMVTPYNVLCINRSKLARDEQLPDPLFCGFRDTQGIARGKCRILVAPSDQFLQNEQWRSLLQAWLSTAR